LSIGGSTFSSSSSLVGLDDDKPAGWAKAFAQQTKKGGSASSSLVGSDEDNPAAGRNKMPPPTNTNRWNQQSKRAAYQQVGASLSSFESTGSESSTSMGPSGHRDSKLFPIPQGRVMTESSRRLSEDSNELNMALTERASNISEGSKELGEDTAHITQSPKIAHASVEKRAPEVNAGEALEGAAIKGCPKRLRRRASKEQCTIQ